MELVLNRFNNFVTNDAAQINFGDQKRFPDGPPAQVKALDPLRDGHESGTIMLDLSKLRYLHSVKGGLRNPDAKHHRYTTEHQTFHVYTVDRQLTPEQVERTKAVGITPDTDDMPTIRAGEDGDVQYSRWLHLVVVSVNGGGNRWVSIQFGDEGNSLLYAVEYLPNCVAHDLLTGLFNGYMTGHQRGVRETAKKYKTAFVEGRLKKRKVRGQEAYNVEIEEPPVTIETKYLTVRIGGSTPFDE